MAQNGDVDQTSYTLLTSITGYGGILLKSPNYTLGNTATGRLTAGDHNVFEAKAPETGAVSVNLNQVGGNSYSTLELLVYGQGGSLITGVSGTYNGNLQTTLNLTAGQDYYFVVSTTGADSSESYSLQVARMTPAVGVTDVGGTYTGSAKAAAATVNGGVSLEGVSPKLTYYSGTYKTAAALTGVKALSGVPSAPSAYTVLASFPGTADSNGASAVADFTITKAPVAFAGLSAPSIRAGTASVTISGKVTGQVLPPAGTLVTVTVAGTTESVMLAASGSFSFTLTTTRLAKGSYTIDFSFPGTADFDAASATSMLTVM